MTFGSESEGSDSFTSLANTASSSGYCLLQPSFQSKKRHVCTFEGCSASFSRPYRLKNHVAKHLGKKPFICDYEDCNKAYTSNMHLKRHISVTHVKDKDSGATESVYPCSFEGCSAVFKFKQNERRHYKRNHILKTCSDCGISFKKTSQLRTHTAQHTGLPIFTCDGCKESFHTKAELRRHIRCHRIHFCPVRSCYEAFSTWSAVRKHLRLHPKVLQCQHCGKTFRTRKSLKSHVDRHLNWPGGVIKRKQPSKKIFECAECGLKFTGGKASLRRHILVQHLGEPSKQKRPRKTVPRATRKDKGIPKRSLAVKLSSVFVEPTLERELLRSQDVDTDLGVPLVPSLTSLCQMIASNSEKVSFEQF